MKTGEKNVRILYTSDIHGRLFARPGEAGLDETGREFRRDGNTLIFDGGDLLQGGTAGTFFAREIWAGEGMGDETERGKAARPPGRELPPPPAAQVMNGCGYDAVTLGNHDFNYGLPYLTYYLTSLNAVCLCANIHSRAGILPVEESRIFTLENGLRIGVFGLCTDALAGWEREETIRQLCIEKPLAAARRVLGGLRGRCDVTVCIYHGGFEEDPATGEVLDDSGENAACELCREPGLDLLLTGHQHLREPGRPLYGSYAVQPGCFLGCYAEVTGTVGMAGEIRFASRLKDGTAVEAAPPMPLPADSPPALSSLRQALENWESRRIGTLPAPIPIQDRVYMALHGSALADFINQVQMAVTGAQISATYLSNTALGLPAEVRVADVFLAYTSANTLCTVRCSGAVLRSALEWTAEFLNVESGSFRIDRRFLRPKPRYFHYDFYAGIDYRLDFSREPGSRVVRLRYGGRDILPEDSFTLCITNYRRAGGDGYGMFRACELLEADPVPVAEHIIGYLSAL